MGDKMSGNAQAAGTYRFLSSDERYMAADMVAGRMTNDPVQYAQGQERKTDTSYGNTGVGTGAGYGSGVGGAGGVGGVGHDNYGNTGSGLTGSHHTGTHSGAHTGTHTGTGVGGVGHNDHNTTGKPSMGDKISGGMDKMGMFPLFGTHCRYPPAACRLFIRTWNGKTDDIVGKATNDPARVAEGEMKTGNPSTTGTGMTGHGSTGVGAPGATGGAYGSGAGTHGTTGGAY
jgi:hypothetical protein